MVKTLMNHKKKRIFRWNRLLNNSFLDGFLHLLFPSACIICDGELLKAEKNCCSVCVSELTYTHFEHAEEPTDLDQLFWGRVPVWASYSLLYYEKTNNVKPILQALKYRNRPDVGLTFGKFLGSRLKTNSAFSSVELLIPVPLHQKKKYLRGYNQSEQLAKGITSAWNIPVNTTLVSKNKHTQSQTVYGRFKRWDNVEDLFYVNKNICKYKHIALVDDVITTGATLESIIRSIRMVSPQIQISVISLAVTK